MKYVEMKKILNELNKKWGLDFVSATSGDCCNSCGSMKTAKATEQWEKANTFIVVKWFFKGMNYNGKFDEQEEIYLKYNLDGVVTISTVCEDLQKALQGNYKVIEPETYNDCILMVKKGNSRLVVIYKDNERQVKHETVEPSYRIDRDIDSLIKENEYYTLKSDNTKDSIRTLIFNHQRYGEMTYTVEVF